MFCAVINKVGLPQAAIDVLGTRMAIHTILSKVK